MKDIHGAFSHLTSHLHERNTLIQLSFFAFVLMHLLLWTVVPALVRDNLPLDAIEGTIWGHQLQWGYDKNPFLNGWLTAFATYLDHQSGWMIYFFSQLSVALCFWGVWQLAKNILPPAYALISVLLLEGIQYYNFHAIDFNDNTLELGLWALTAYFFYRALRTPTYHAWILTGLFAALGMMAKYYTAALLAAMALLLFCHAEHRRQLKTLPPYLGLGTFFIIILPHVIWLFSHDFITVTYVFERASSIPHWSNHFYFPLEFAWQQLQAFLPAGLLLAFLLLGKKPLLATSRHALSLFNKQFLLYVGLGPLLLTLLLSLLLGIKLRAGWGMPLQSLWGIMLVAAVQPRLSNIKIISFVIGIFSLMLAFLSGYSVSLIASSSSSSANFPGRELAQLVTEKWHDTYHVKLDYVAGSRWLGGNIEFYSSDHPAVFVEWNEKHAPWIMHTDLQQKGAVFIWDITSNETLPTSIQKRYPELQQPIVIELAWHRNVAQLAPVKIGLAFLPPKKFSQS